MARIARAVAPGIPHHVTQRGNRRQQTFFNEDDYQAYLELMSEWCLRYGVDVWGYRFTHEELDFIINYDIKYRMGKELDSGEDNDD